MTSHDDKDTTALRMAYNVAVAMHAGCVHAITEARMRGETDTKTLVEAELAARGQKQEMRKKLHAAMASALGPPPESSKPVR